MQGKVFFSGMTKEEHDKMLQASQAGKDSPVSEDCDCEQADPKARSNLLLAQDMISFECAINTIGVETRTEDTDHFRDFWDIMMDIAVVISNNPSIVDHLRYKKITTSDEHAEALKGYLFDGVEGLISILKEENS